MTEDLYLRLYPDPVLKRRATPLREIDDTVRARARRMFDVMYENAGIGLAGPQVGWSERIFVINLSADPEQPDGEMVFINPVVTEPGEPDSDEEGCLSIPDLRAPVRRPVTVHVAATDLVGRRFEFDADDLLARCVQHELDHLDGILFIERTTFAAKLTMKKALKAMERDFKQQGDG